MCDSSVGSIKVYKRWWFKSHLRFNVFFFVSSLKDGSSIPPESNNFVSPPPLCSMDFCLTIKLNVQRYIILGTMLKRIIVES